MDALIHTAAATMIGVMEDEIRSFPDRRFNGSEFGKWAQIAHLQVAPEAGGGISILLGLENPVRNLKRETAFRVSSTKSPTHGALMNCNESTEISLLSSKGTSGLLA